MIREIVPLTPKVFDILLTLIESSGHVISKDDLMKKVWPDSFVEEGNLTQNISLLRKALGEGQNGHKFIETIARRGYRFVLPVSESSDEPTIATENAITSQTAIASNGGQSKIESTLQPETADGDVEIVVKRVTRQADSNITSGPRSSLWACWSSW